MMRWRAVQIFLLVTLASASVLAQAVAQPPSKPAAADTSATGAITGRVVDDRGQPLVGAAVFVRPVGSGTMGQSVSTDREGAFNVSGIDRASYQVSAAMPAYTTPPPDPNTPASTYHIGDSVTLMLIKGGVVTGTVTNLLGEPVVAINVRVQMIRDANGRRLVNGWSQQKPTDDRGVYRTYGLPAGTYVVLAGGPMPYMSSGNPFDTDAPTYAPSATRDMAAELSVRAGEEIGGIDIRYRAEQGRIVSGEVSGPPDFGPAFNVTLTTAAETGAPWSNSQYQEPNSRRFSFTGIGDGDYFLIAQSYAPNSERAVSTATAPSSTASTS